MEEEIGRVCRLEHVDYEGVLDRLNGWYHLDMQPAVEKAFSVQPTAICCVDGRTPTPKIGIAGCGVYQTDSQIEKTVGKIEEKNPIYHFRTHECCGAEALKREELIRKGIDYLEASKIVDQLTRRLARKTRHEYAFQRVGYSNTCDVGMAGNPDLHDEKMIVIAGKDFDPSVLGLPRYFYSSFWCAPDDDYMRWELKLMLDIALGKNGLGKKYFSKEKLIVLMVGDQENEDGSLDRFMDVLNPILEQKEYNPFVSRFLVEAPTMEFVSDLIIN